MRKLARTAAFVAGILVAAGATAHAQYNNAPGSPYQASPYYGYNYQYPSPGYGYNYSTYAAYGSYIGQAYPAAPKAFWDPYVGYRPYSDNAGPKASGHGD